MAFKNIFRSKTLSAAFGAILFCLASSAVMAAPALEQAATPGGDEANATMWTGVGYYVLLFLLAAIVIGIVGKILRVYDLTAQIQGKKPINWNNIMGIVCILFLLAGLYGAYWEFTEQGTQTLPEAASVHGVKLDSMFTVTFFITVIVFFLTQICLFGFSFLYRGSDKRKAYFYPHNNTIEKIWTVIPAIVLTILVITGFFTWKTVTNSLDVKGDIPAIDVDITGHQFAWEIRYPGKDHKLGNKDYKLTTPNNKIGLDFKDPKSLDDQVADTIYLPVNKPVRLNIIAQDVIHSVYMPHFRVQINAVPGLPTYFKFTPTLTTNEMRAKLGDPKFEYLLYCNKICGGGHYNMQKFVRVVSEAEYLTWVAAQKPYFNDALKKELKMAESKQPKALGENKLALNN